MFLFVRRTLLIISNMKCDRAQENNDINIKFTHSQKKIASANARVMTDEQIIFTV